MRPMNSVQISLNNPQTGTSFPPLEALNAAADLTTRIAGFAIHSLFGRSLDKPCEWDDPLRGTCTMTSASETKAERFEYVKDRLRSEKIRCVAVALPEGKILYEPVLAALVNRIIDSKPAREILNQVLQDGPVTILSAGSQGAPQGGSWEALSRTVRLHKAEDADRKLGHLLYELINAMQFNEQMKFFSNVQSGKVDKESYVKSWERLEFSTNLQFISAIQKCIAEHQWPEEADLGLPLAAELGIEGIEWPEYWSLIKDSDHANQYRSDWINNGMRTIYCEKNPRKPDCT